MNTPSHVIALLRLLLLEKALSCARGMNEMIMLICG